MSDYAGELAMFLKYDAKPQLAWPSIEEQQAYWTQKAAEEEDRIFVAEQSYDQFQIDGGE